LSRAKGGIDNRIENFSQKRKVKEAERIRAYEDMKLREQELASIKMRGEDEDALQKKKILEENHKRIQAMRDEIHKTREARVHENEEREKKRRAVIEREAFKKFHKKVVETPDSATVARQARMKEITKGGKSTEPADSDDDDSYDL